MKKRILSILSVLVLSLLLSSCSTEEKSEKPIVYASFFPIYDLVHQVAGDTVMLKSFMPMNVDPHLWEPTAKDMKELSKADILFVNGANMEKWVDKVRENLPDLNIVTLSEKLQLISYKGAADLGDFQYMTKMQGKAGETYRFDFGHTHEDYMRVTFLKKDANLDEKAVIEKAKEIMKQKGEVTPQKATINVEEGKVYALEMGHVNGKVFFEYPSDGEWYVVSDRISEPILSYQLTDKDGKNAIPVEDVVTHSTSSHDKITYDPHSWLSIKNAKKYLIEINRVLGEQYPEHKKMYKKASFKSLDQLTTLHAQFKEKFDALDADKEFVVTHYAWEYLAQEYGLMQYPLQGLVSMDSPSLRTVKRAVAFCKEKNISTVFNEATLDPKNAITLAQEIDGQVEDLTSMEYISNAEELEVGAYNRIMEENLEKLYQAMKGGRR